MEKINLCEGVVAQMMDTEAWGNVSGDFPFSEAQLEKYADKLDWKEVSGNTNIFWSVQMLEKFKRRIDWTALPRCLQEENVSAELLEKFKDNWNTGRSSRTTAASLLNSSTSSLTTSTGRL